MKPLTRIAIVLMFIVLIGGTASLVNLELKLSPDGIVPDSRTMVVYMTLRDNQNIDAVASASCTEERPKPNGITEQVAVAIQERTGAAIRNIVVKDFYPADMDKLAEQTKKEKAEGAMPDFRTIDKKASSYDTLFIGFPIWWDDMPRVVYSYLDRTDLVGKKIYIFTCSDSGKPSDFVEKIASYEPNSEINPNVLNIRTDQAQNETIGKQVEDWLKELGLN